MFKHLRVQILHPCQAKCAWCSTHRKNDLFRDLHESGESEAFHEAYLDAIHHVKPEEVFVSGGEPLLYPNIDTWLRKAAEATKTIHVFTSYQFNRRVMDRFAAMDLPTDQIVLNHTPIYFEPERWHDLTRGFPFDIYIDNVRKAARLPIRKRFKFIINHELFVEEIQRFQQLVEPDETCEISLKIMNDQGAGLWVDEMKESAQTMFGRLADLDAVLADAGWRNKKRPKTSADAMKETVMSGDVTRCPYRNEPIELRFAFDKAKNGKRVLKYRYCPYFPPDFGHRFHIGRDDMAKVVKNYRKGPFRDHCGRCRLLHYSEEAPTKKRLPVVA